MLRELALLLVLWRPAFARKATWVRAVSVLLGLIVGNGRRTLTASIVARGRRDAPWSADYLAFSRAPWNVCDLFDGVLRAAVATADGISPGQRYLCVGIDDTSIRKSGKTITAARWYRDPMSPPFRFNLQRGLRYLHMALILPLHEQGRSARAVTVDFTPAPSVRKPGKRATAEQVAASKAARKLHNLSQVAARRVLWLRQQLDAAGLADRDVLLVGDGSFTNRNVLRQLPDRVQYLGRTRSNLALCVPAEPGGRRVYGDRLPTPVQIRQDPDRPWTSVSLHYAGARRVFRYKQVVNVLWRTGTLRRPMRLIIVAPIPYWPQGAKGRGAYRKAAYLLTTDLTTDAGELLQAYLGRWQLEVEHRDLKTGLGVGQAQVWNDKSVARLHSAHAAMWSMVKLAAFKAHGFERTDAYPPRPAWYPQQPNDRASQADIVAALRADLKRHRTGPPEATGTRLELGNEAPRLLPYAA